MVEDVCTVHAPRVTGGVQGWPLGAAEDVVADAAGPEKGGPGESSGPPGMGLLRGVDEDRIGRPVSGTGIRDQSSI